MPYQPILVVCWPMPYADDQATPAQKALIAKALAYRALPSTMRGVAPTIVGLNGRWRPRYDLRSADFGCDDALAPITLNQLLQYICPECMHTRGVFYGKNNFS
jgi:hypothetical protein